MGMNEAESRAFVVVTFNLWSDSNKITFFIHRLLDPFVLSGHTLWPKQTRSKVSIL